MLMFTWIAIWIRTLVQVTNESFGFFFVVSSHFKEKRKKKIRKESK